MMPWEPVLQLVPSHVPPERVLAGAGVQGSCPPASLQPSAGAALGTTGQGRGRQMLEGLSPPLTRPPGPSWSCQALALQALVQSQGHWFQRCPVSPHGRGPEAPSCSRTALPRLQWGRAPQPPAPRWGFPKASSQGPALGCGCFSPGCAGVWGCSAGSARAGLG